jgi:hypothetical protein
MLTLLAVLSLAAPVPKPGPDWVTLKGTVVWPEKEKIPEAKGIDLSKVQGGDADYLRKGGAVFDEKFVIDPKTRGLKDVVVWLRPDDDDPKAKFPAEKIHPDLAKAKPATHTVTSEYGRFDKRVLVARAGDSVKVVNKGEVTIAPSFTGGEKSASYTLHPGKEGVVLEDVPAGVSWFDDLLHQGWLNGQDWPPGHGRLRVFDHPYFAVTNELGEFEIPQVPRGKWRVMYCHPQSGYHKGKDGRLGFPVEVRGNDDATLTLKAVAYEQPKK